MRELSYVLEAGRRKQPAQLKEKEADLYTRVERSFERILQRTIDQISKDAIAGIDKTSYMSLTSDWQRKAKQIMLGNKPVGLEGDVQYNYQTPHKGYATPSPCIVGCLRNRT